MDETTSPKRKADGIRRTMDSVTPKHTLGVTHVRSSARTSKDHSDRQRTDRSVLLRDEMEEQLQTKRTTSQKTSVRDSPVIKDKMFKKLVFPRHFFFLRNKNIIAFMLGTGIIAVVVILLSTVFAQVTVTVKPTVESVQLKNIFVTFDAAASEVDTNKRIVPAEFLTFTDTASQEFEATGKDYGESAARGRVRIINSFSTSPQALVVHTRFLTDTGILYRLPASITIPGAKSLDGKLVAQFVETDLIADKPGEESNIDGEVKLLIPGFKGTPKYEGFSAIAQNGFSGGSKGESRVVTQQDLILAQEQVTKKVFDDLKVSMARKIPANFTFVENLSQIEVTAVSAPKEKSKVDRFTVEAKAAGYIFVFRNDDMLKILGSIILNDDTSRELITKSADIRYRIKEANYKKKIANVEISGAIKIKKVIPSAELTDVIRDKKEGSLIEALKQRREIATFKVAFFPPWIFSAPNNTRNIHIVIEDPSIEVKSR